MSNGLIRLAAPPGGRVLVLEIRGDINVTGDETIPDIITYLLQTYTSEMNIDVNSLIRYKAEIQESGVPQRAGIYISNEAKLRDILSQLINSVGGCLAIDRLNRIYLTTLQRGVPVAYISDRDIISNTFRRESPPKPGNSHKFGFRRAYFTLSESDLLGAADPIFRTLALEEYRYAVQNEYIGQISNRFATAETKTVNTFFEQSVSARRASELITYREQAFRDVYRFDLYGFSWKIQIGDTVVIEYPRFGLTVPKMGVVIGITERSPTSDRENITSLTVWS
jgi:hypothetical protein